MVKFAIDLDGVCFDSQDVVDWYNKLYRTLFNKREFFSQGFCDRLGISQEVFEQRITQMYKSFGVRKLTLVPGAVSGVRELSTIGGTLAVTSRPSWACEDTHYCLETNFNGAFNEGVHFTRNRHIQNNGHVQTKLDVCIREGVSYLIEDDLYYALPCAEKGIRVLLFDYYGDKSKLPENVHLVYSWPKTVAKIKEIEGIKSLG